MKEDQSPIWPDSVFFTDCPGNTESGPVCCRAEKHPLDPMYGLQHLEDSSPEWESKRNVRRIEATAVASYHVLLGVSTMPNIESLSKSAKCYQ